MLGQPLKSERGNVLLATAILSLMLIFAMFSVNAAYYYSYKARLASVANTIASQAGTYLPDVPGAIATGTALFPLLKQELSIPGDQVTDRFPADLTMKTFIEFYDSNTHVLKRVEVSSSDTPTSWDYELPVKSVTFQLSATYGTKLLNLFKASSGDVATMTVQAEASAQLIPTDIMLVVENSNSLASNIAEESNPVPSAFSMWDSISPGRKNATGYTYSSNFTDTATKARLYERHCFGTLAKSMKRAALMAFDALTSSATYRVGVLHTHNPLGEFPTPTINITPDSYLGIYWRHTLSSLKLGVDASGSSGFNDLIYRPQSNVHYGTFDYPETRCAALTAQAEYGVPHHLAKLELPDSFYQDYFIRSVTGHLKCFGVYKPSDCPNNSHLSFDASLATIMPRELIWIANSGGSYESGVPNPRYDYVHMQFAIQRAMELLNAAPARSDGLPVRRRLVLVLTDGFERPTTYETGYNEALEDRTFQYLTQQLSASTSFSTLSSIIAYPSGSSSVFDSYCSNTSGNLIYSSTQPVTNSLPADNDRGIHLGILYLEPRHGFNKLDVSVRLQNLHGHDSADTDAAGIAAFRSACNTKWGNSRGRFLVESTAKEWKTIDSSGGTEDSMYDTSLANYYEKVVPYTLRSTFISELVHTNGS